MAGRDAAAHRRGLPGARPGPTRLLAPRPAAAPPRLPHRGAGRRHAGAGRRERRRPRAPGRARLGWCGGVGVRRGAPGPAAHRHVADDAASQGFPRVDAAQCPAPALLVHGLLPAAGPARAGVHPADGGQVAPDAREDRSARGRDRPLRHAAQGARCRAGGDQLVPRRTAVEAGRRQDQRPDALRLCDRRRVPRPQGRRPDRQLRRRAVPIRGARGPDPLAAGEAPEEVAGLLLDHAAAHGTR